MLIGTHTLHPVCAGLLIENAALAKGRGHFFPPLDLHLAGDSPRNRPQEREVASVPRAV
jgi:hypothetical protein